MNMANTQRKGLGGPSLPFAGMPDLTLAAFLSRCATSLKKRLYNLINFLKIPVRMVLKESETATK